MLKAKKKVQKSRHNFNLANTSFDQINNAVVYVTKKTRTLNITSFAKLLLIALKSNFSIQDNNLSICILVQFIQTTTSAQRRSTL